MDAATGLTRWACIGTGAVDYAGQIAALRRDGYRGALSGEPHWRKPGDSVPESTREPSPACATSFPLPTFRPVPRATLARSTSSTASLAPMFTSMGWHVFREEVAVRLGSRNVFQPDLAFYRPEREDRIHDNHVECAPDLVVEACGQDLKTLIARRTDVDYGDFESISRSEAEDPCSGQGRFSTTSIRCASTSPRNCSFPTAEFRTCVYRRSRGRPRRWRQVDCEPLFNDAN